MRATHIRETPEGGYPFGRTWLVHFGGGYIEKMYRPDRYQIIADWLAANAPEDSFMISGDKVRFWKEEDAIMCYLAFK